MTKDRRCIKCGTLVLWEGRDDMPPDTHGGAVTYDYDKSAFVDVPACGGKLVPLLESTLNN